MFLKPPNRRVTKITLVSKTLDTASKYHNCSKPRQHGNHFQWDRIQVHSNPGSRETPSVMLPTMNEPLRWHPLSTLCSLIALWPAGMTSGPVRSILADNCPEDVAANKLTISVRDDTMSLQQQMATNIYDFITRSVPPSLITNGATGPLIHLFYTLPLTVTKGFGSFSTITFPGLRLVSFGNSFNQHLKHGSKTVP